MNSKNKDLASNRRAWHDYEILETFETGIVLKGTEVKSLRTHSGSLQEAYVKLFHNEVWLVGSNIAHYRFGNIHNHEEKRDRKLLLHKREIFKLKTLVQEKGMTIVPLSLFLKKGLVKVKIGIAKGRKKSDKRAVIKERHQKREIERMMKNIS